MIRPDHDYRLSMKTRACANGETVEIALALDGERIGEPRYVNGETEPIEALNLLLRAMESLTRRVHEEKGGEV